MGVELAASCVGHRVWASAGRSRATVDRAARAGLDDVTSMSSMSTRADIIVSVCPPGAALDVARSVAGTGFDGIYVDANAVSPATAKEIVPLFGRFVDGGIVGPPPNTAGSTRIYLSGPDAPQVGSLWEGSVLEARVLAAPVGAASAVKMCFAAWTKGTAALLLATRALAEAEDVSDALLEEWATSMPDLAARSEATAAGVGPKAWRFEPEMREIAASFAAAGLPAGFHEAAAEVYEQLAGFKDHPSPTLEHVLQALVTPNVS